MHEAFPEQFNQRLSSIIPEQWRENVRQSYIEPKKTCFRINSFAGEISETLEELKKVCRSLKEITGFQNTFSIEANERETLTHHELISSGKVYIQNPSSMLPVQLLDVEPGQENLDLAAAPGGKASLIANYMNNQGRLACVEPAKTRFFKLKSVMELLQVSCHQLYLDDGRKTGKKCPERFDRVLLDAPCSGEARFDPNTPDTFDNWSLKKVRSCAKKQKSLIESAFQCLKPGGIMVYSTCAFSPEENEAVASSLLERHKNAKIENLECPPSVCSSNGLLEWQEKPFHPDLKHSLRIWPNKIFDGFFMVKISKSKMRDNI